MKSDLIDVAMQIHHRTERAILASDDGDEKRAVWIPLSQVEVLMKSAGVAEVTMPEWLAIEKGLV
jgi:uncharacterized protein YabE (DUF348 family)